MNKPATPNDPAPQKEKREREEQEERERRRDPDQWPIKAPPADEPTEFIPVPDIEPEPGADPRRWPERDKKA